MEVRAPVALKNGKKVSNWTCLVLLFQLVAGLWWGSLDVCFICMYMFTYQLLLWETWVWHRGTGFVSFGSPKSFVKPHHVCMNISVYNMLLNLMSPKSKANTDKLHPCRVCTRHFLVSGSLVALIHIGLPCSIIVNIRRVDPKR